jgi:hypothetical protein
LCYVGYAAGGRRFSARVGLEFNLFTRSFKPRSRGGLKSGCRGPLH